MAFMWFSALLLVSGTLADQFASSPVQYQFAYSTGDEGPARMFREERRAPDGQVTGKYGYVDPYGHMRIVQYEAGPQGFVARGDVGPDQEALRISRQLAEDDFKEKLPILQHWSQVARNLASPPAVPNFQTAIPTAQTWGSEAIPVSPVVQPVAPKIERARFTAFQPALQANSWDTGKSSYSSNVNHFANNIQTVWPTAPRAAIQLPSLSNQFAQFSLSQSGPQPYSINYSY
ncbi:uncharacterized protein LOC141854532 [Brevipalpus obovatus]|uniref:uncharacterized protein LOC141854532 n=1 Tax=Brevipalpus obovatus TaxID=246614 RepID=UPI003D9E9A23